MKKTDCRLFDEACLALKPDKRGIILLKEEGERSTYKGINKDKKTLCVYHVDKCKSMSWPGKSCDFLILDAVAKRAYFIELKGQDISSAIKQLNNSIDNLIGSLMAFSIFGRIVPSKIGTLSLNSSKFLLLKNRLKELNGDLQLKNKIFEENL